jgi:hypothetical protein
MRNTWIALTLGALLVVGAPGPGDATGDAVPFPASTRAATSPEIAAAATGGDNYFYCAAAQVVKYVGLVTGNVGLIVGGAIAGGIACGFGW